MREKFNDDDLLTRADIEETMAEVYPNPNPNPNTRSLSGRYLKRFWRGSDRHDQNFRSPRSGVRKR